MTYVKRPASWILRIFTLERTAYHYSYFFTVSLRSVQQVRTTNAQMQGHTNAVYDRVSRYRNNQQCFVSRKHWPQQARYVKNKQTHSLDCQLAAILTFLSFIIIFFFILASRVGITPLTHGVMQAAFARRLNEWAPEPRKRKRNNTSETACGAKNQLIATRFFLSSSEAL